MRLWTFVVLTLVVLLGGCDSVVEPSVGHLRVIALTSGGDLDEDGYQLSIDHGAPEPLPLSSGIQSFDLPAGEYHVQLSGAADNCEIVGGGLRRVQVRAGRDTDVQFSVNCFVTGIRLLITTSGVDQDADGYFVEITGLGAVFLATNGNGLLSRLVPGVHEVSLKGLASNCTTQGESRRAVSVSSRHVTDLAFVVTCVATTGIIEIRTVSTGEDIDPNGYAVLLFGLARGLVASNGVQRLPIEAGVYEVEIGGVAPNCTVTSLLTQAATIRGGGLTRDTARVAFEIACARTEKIAFVQGDFVVVAYSDGSNGTTVATGSAPAWSPAGDYLAFESIRCAAAYSGEPTPPPPQRCTRLGLGIARPNGTEARLLTTFVSDRNPAWSPDGRYIAFDTDGQLQIIDVQSGTRAQLNPPTAASTQPVWSPDGQKIAFTCLVSLSHDICVVNRDGSGFVRLTNEVSQESDPAWSPDGSLIAFVTSRFSGRDDIAVMTATGADVRRFVSGNAPTWSKDGTKLFFAISGLGLASVNLDGSGFTVLTRQGEYAPVFRW